MTNQSKLPEIQQQGIYLREGLDKTNTLLDELVQKLAPVLVNDTKTGVLLGKGETTDSLCPLALEIKSNTDLVSIINEDIKAIISRVQL